MPVAQLVSSLHSHAAVLAAEISEIEHDLERVDLLKVKYGPESFAYGDGKLRDLLMQKQSHLQQVQRQLRSLQTSVADGKALAESLEQLHGTVAGEDPSKASKLLAGHEVVSSAFRPGGSNAPWRGQHDSGSPVRVVRGASAGLQAYEVVTDSPILAHATVCSSTHIMNFPA
eukprot:GGOE01018100.1.p1 GENE.GGOE01018100.1~~GGOE01018100.1.p1  ORF type:complete len:172 (+),score=31.83 GGOE01018100.1:31-546(+)